MALSPEAAARILQKIKESGVALTGGAVATPTPVAAPVSQQPTAPAQSTPIPSSNYGTSTMPGVVQKAVGTTVTNPLGTPTPPVVYTNPTSPNPGPPQSFLNSQDGKSVNATPVGSTPIPASNNATSTSTNTTSGNGLSDKTNAALQSLLGKVSPDNPLIPASSQTTTSDTKLGTGVSYEPQNSSTQTPIPASNNQAAQPAQQTGYGQLTPEQIRAEAAARIARDRAAISGAVNSFKTGVKNSYEYGQQITGDSRALQDGQLGRLKNPYSGGTDYQKAMLERNRGIQDTATDNDYQAQISQAEQKLLDFEALAPEQQQTIFNELQRQERDYGLSVGALTGYLGNQRTLAGQQFDYSQTRDTTADSQWQQQFDQNQSELDWAKSSNNPAVKLQVWNANLAKQEAMNYPAQVKADLAKANQYLQAGKIDIDTANYQLEQFTNPNSIYNQSQKVGLQLSQLELSQTTEQGKLEVQKLRSQIADIGRVKPTTQAESEMDKAKLAKVNAEIAKIEADTQKSLNGTVEKPETSTIESEYIRNIAKLSPSQTRDLFNNDRADIVADLGIAGYNRLYSMYFDEKNAYIPR